MKRKNRTPVEGAATTDVRADPRPSFTPAQVADRWHWHPESVRRALRERRIASIVISRCRLILASEVERSEREGFIARAV